MKRIAVLALPLALLACKQEEVQTLVIRTAPVARRTIVLDATASGAVEPINVVEVKSKSSGQIVQMTVETGSRVGRGDLLVQLETRDVQNQFDQAKADLNAADAKLQVSEAQKKRADDLFAQRITTAQEHETAQLDYANSQASLIRARTSLDLAQQRLDDATVRAPSGGTIIEKTVSLGQVITSATSGFGGGTTLLKMADLSKVRMRALFNETDIGSVSSRQQATVTVDAYPERPFRGVVEKIEPQAVVQQSVTMFPVLINLENREGLLKPGMNGEASVLVDRRDNVLSVPNDAIRSSREAPMMAGVLGLAADTVAAAIQMQMGQSGGLRQGGREMGGAPPGAGGAPGGARVMQGEVALSQQPGSPRRAAGAPSTAPGGGARQGAGGSQGGRGGASTPVQSGEFPMRTRTRTAVVFVAENGTYTPKVVKLGVANFDYTEVVSGLKDGDQVALLATAAIQAARDSSNARFKQMTGGGMPGMQKQPTTSGSTAPAGGPPPRP